MEVPRVKPCSRLSVCSVLLAAGCQRDRESRAITKSAWGDVKFKGTREKAVKEYIGKKYGKRERWKGVGEIEKRKYLETKASVLRKSKKLRLEKGE